MKDGDDAIHEIGVGDGPLEGLSTPNDGPATATRWVTPRRIRNRAAPDNIPHGKIGELWAVGLARRRVEASWTSRPVAGAEHVGGDHKEARRIDRSPGSNETIPPTHFAICRAIAPGSVVIAGIAVGDENGIATIRCQPSIGVIGDGHIRQDLSGLQCQATEVHALVLNCL